ncbi:beta-phosphoglucomutase [Sesbania bispinosa]|nr:beta-phosphoglucomutase [Sesbania bispinosa]
MGIASFTVNGIHLISWLPYKAFPIQLVEPLASSIWKLSTLSAAAMASLKAIGSRAMELELDVGVGNCNMKFTLVSLALSLYFDVIAIFYIHVHFSFTVSGGSV